MKFTIRFRPGYGAPIEVEIPDDLATEAARLGAAVLAAKATGAYLRGAYLRGQADTKDREVTYVSGHATRSDGYEFVCFKMAEGDEIIRVGCRTFSLAEFRAHVAAHYPDSPKGAETLMILAHLEASLKLER